MRKILWVLVLLAATAPRVSAVAQQPLEVVIVGTSHYNGSDTAAYRPLINRLKAYRPDLVFGEYLAPADVRQLRPGQPTAIAYQRRQQYMRRQALRTPPLPDRAAAAARRRLRKDPLLSRARIDLARYYALQDDRANAEYQLYLLEQPYQSRMSAAERAYYQQAFGPADSVRKTARLVRPLTEYHKIFFPLLRELGQDQLYSMDCQRYEDAWNQASSEAYGGFVALQTGFKTDSSTAAAATYRRIARAKPAFFAYLEAAPDDVAAYRLMNEPGFEKLNDELNFYGDAPLYGAAGFPTEAVRAMRAQWLLRNEGMCANIVQRARAAGAHRVVVAVGSAHAQIMRRLLAATPGVQARTLNELP